MIEAFHGRAEELRIGEALIFLHAKFFEGPHLIVCFLIWHLGLGVALGKFRCGAKGI